MSDLGETLIGLLDGDFVRLEATEVTVTAEVIDHQRELGQDPAGGQAWYYTLRFMPVGETAAGVDADRYRVAVEPDARDGWTVGELVAEVYVEDELTYKPEPRGELLSVEVLDEP